MCPPYLWGRPSYYCSQSCAKQAAKHRAHLRAAGLLDLPVPAEPLRREVATCEVRVVIIEGVMFDVVWHGAIEGHWSPVRGGLILRDE